MKITETLGYGYPSESTHLELSKAYNMARFRWVLFFLQASANVNPSNAKATVVYKHKGAKIFENQLNPVMLVFIG